MADLRTIVAEAIIRTADRPPTRRGPWIFNEAELQESAAGARRFLARAALKEGSENG